MKHSAFIPYARAGRRSDVFRASLVMAVIAGVVFNSSAHIETARSSVRALSSRTKPESKSVLSVKGVLATGFTLATGLWRSAGHLADPRFDHTQTLLPDGGVLLVGGHPFASTPRCEVYDPRTNQWSLTGSLKTNRIWHTATLLANGKVLVAGGTDGRDLFRVELFNPASGTWEDAASVPTTFEHHTATLLKNGKVLLAGGDRPGSSYSNSTALYDPIANTWATGVLPSGRSHHTATLLRDGKVLLVGGQGSSGLLATAIIYNPDTNTWSAAANMSVGRIGHTATLLQNGKVLVVGGGFTPLNFGATDTAELYDPSTNVWSNVGKLNATRSSHTATLLTNGKVLVTGGDGTGGASSELFDPTTNTWTYTGGLNDDRAFHTATLLNNGSVLIAGGYGEVSELAEAELYDPAAGDTGGQKLVFASSRNGGNHDIYVMNPNGSNQTRLTTNPAYDDQPKWSPDGSKIAFISNRDLNFEIYTMNADGTGQTRLTNNPAGDGFPAWSPDGKKIAFVSGDLRNPQSFEIYVMNSDGSNRTRLTNDSLIDCLPSWSPDGKTILFMSGPASLFDINSFELFAMNADGSNRIRLTNNTVADGQASYSPDGTKILFASGDAMNPNGIEIFLMNADGSNRTRLTNNSVTDGFPAWSSDGSKIVFASGNIGDERTVEISTMNPDGSNQTRVTNNSGLDWFVDWQPTPASQIRFGSASYMVGEGAGSALVTVVRSGDTSTGATIEYATNDAAGANSCALVNGIASSRCDYLATAGTLSFAANETSKSIAIPIIDDSYAEGQESFSITLGNPVNSALGSPATVTVNLVDNETVNETNPIETAGIFVRQHYLDFLNREPDNSGLSFWTNEITSCGADAGCTEVKRVNVSASFFLSIEFQGTGYLVERIYKAAYGDAMGTSSLGGTHQLAIPVIRLNEFLPDVQEIGQGVVVLQPGWEQVLEGNKKAFTAEFVQRSRFISAFPASMAAADFVDKLNTNAGNPLSQSERNRLVTDLSTNAKTRAEVVRSVAEHPNLINAEFNRAFVLMQYFGYLRRNPNDSSDSDHTGYNFWLNKLNQFNGDYIAAEMVKAFISSTEYRQRFGP